MKQTTFDPLAYTAKKKLEVGHNSRLEHALLAH
jgi:hypothetical protein